MTLSRQQAFQQLRPVCVELSARALHFKGQQATVKQVLRALQDVQLTLGQPQIQAALDEKLAEYTFFPLTHIFNQSQALSSTCIEIAIQCVIVLVTEGWRHHIATEMGKQLLILMSLLAGGQTKTGGTLPSNELKTQAFTCIKVVAEALGGKDEDGPLFNDLGSRSVTDQLAYLLLESITETPSDQAQLAASDAMTAVVVAISDRVVLASLLPRTASALTQALRISTKARRTRKVLSSYLTLLRILLQAVLADSIVYPFPIKTSNQNPGEKQSDALDESWLRATAEQVNIALIQVMRLRNHEHSQVQTALADLCFMVVEDCPKSLSATLAIAIESLIYLAHLDDAQIRARLEFLTTSQTAVAEIVREKFYDWCRSLPRTMQGNEDRLKEQLFGQIGAAFSILSHTGQISDEIMSSLVTGLIEGLSTAKPSSIDKPVLSEETSALLASALDLQRPPSQRSFPKLILTRPNEENSSRQLDELLSKISERGYANQLAQACLTQYIDAEEQDHLLSAWLTLQCLSRAENETFDMSSFFVIDHVDRLQMNRPQLISDLYAQTLVWLTEEEFRDEWSDWRMIAVAIESTVLQAKQLGTSYRPELLDTLYPMLSLLGSNKVQVREHAMAALNELAAACGYSATSDMLVDNADYLINSVSMKLNAFDITPQAPQVLLMMIRLCGSRIVPQLEDLVVSMFSALDNFHGYPRLVGTLFEVLRAMIDEAKRQPHLALTDGMTQPQHHCRAVAASSIEDILGDLEHRRRQRQGRMRKEEEALRKEPQPTWPPEGAEIDKGAEEADDTDAENSAEQDNKTATGNSVLKLSKAHQLLLSIAQATAPHLSSPAPQVRQTLLQLLDEVSPLLAQDENSFLPLVNSVWPVVVPRLLAFSPASEEVDSETAYNACAAANVISTLCRGAGNFMSSRIDDILPQVRKLFQDVLQGQKTPPRADRSSRSQMLSALVRLLATILSYVRLSEDSGDQLFEMLAPFSAAPDIAEVKPALERYNPDALWVWNQRQMPIIAASVR